MSAIRIAARTIPASMALLLTLWAAPGLLAIEVTTTADENGANSAACALREAVRAINDESSFGGCTFTPSDTLIELGEETYQLSLNVGVTDRVQISSPMTIQGQGPDQTIIERAGAFDDDMLFIVLEAPGLVTLEGFTLRGSTGTFNSAIDYIARTGHELLIRNLVFRDNAANGAPLRIQGDADGTARLEQVLFEDNINTDGFGGGIDCSAPESSLTPFVSLVDVIFRNNVVNDDDGFSTALGGGFLSEGCQSDLENVTFDNNSAFSSSGDSFGGGLAITSGDIPANVTLTNVTFFGNSADTGGGLIQGESSGSPLAVTLSNVTFAGNSASLAGDHLFQDSGSTSLRNVLFGPSTEGGCASTLNLDITLLGGNMDSDGTCLVEQTEADPGLAGTLEQQGGFTPTVALVPGAAAIDAGTNSDCPATDQRGAQRPFDGDGDEVAVCDVGAFELAPILIFADGFESGDTGGWSFSVPCSSATLGC